MTIETGRGGGMTGARRPRSTGTRRAGVIAAAVGVLVILGPTGPSSADVTAVSGRATGFLSRMSLFGGPLAERGQPGDPGCDPSQAPPGPNASQTEGCSPTVTLPPTGAPEPITATDLDGVRAVYGPGVLFGGRWPQPSAFPPPSGPITVSTQGMTGPKGSVTSSVSITKPPSGSTWLPPGQTRPALWPGGLGPGPILADGVTSTCSATETNPATGASVVRGATTITNGALALATDQYGSPADLDPMPTNPRANDGPHHGVLTNIGDSYDVFYNEQDTSIPGTITVTAIHMRMLGPTATGDLYIAQSSCGIKSAPGSTARPTIGGPPAGSTVVCAQLAAARARLNAQLDALRASLPTSLPADERARILAQAETTRAQGMAQLDRLGAQRCPPGG